ncbi:MAG: hypothetical protein AAF430_10290 [Myxococcota bacterium]
MSRILRTLVVLATVSLVSPPALANIPYTAGELTEEFYNVWFDEEGCSPDWVIETSEFDEPGPGQYTLWPCDGGPPEVGSYTLLPSGVLRITFSGTDEYLRRINYDPVWDGYQICDADTEADTLNCSATTLSESYEFYDLKTAQVFQEDRVGYIPYTGIELVDITMYIVRLDPVDCGPAWVLETIEFDSAGSGSYSLDRCGGPTEVGTYTTTPSGSLVLTSTSGVEYVRRFDFPPGSSGSRQCVAATEPGTLTCTESELDTNFQFKDMAQAQSFLAQQNSSSVPGLGVLGLVVLSVALVVGGRRAL